MLDFHVSYKHIVVLPVVLFVLGLLGVSYFEVPNVIWYGFHITGFKFWLLSLVLLCLWFGLALYRKYHHQLEHYLWPAAWMCFVLFAMVWAAGIDMIYNEGDFIIAQHFPILRLKRLFVAYLLILPEMVWAAGIDMIYNEGDFIIAQHFPILRLKRLFVAYLVVLGLAYVLILAEPINMKKLGNVWSLMLEARPFSAFWQMPLSVESLSMSIDMMILCVIMYLIMGESIVPVMTIGLFVLRDFGIVLASYLSGKTKHPQLVGVGALAILNIGFPKLLEFVGVSQLSSVFLPLLDFQNVWIMFVVTAEAGLVWWWCIKHTNMR